MLLVRTIQMNFLQPPTFLKVGVWMGNSVQRFLWALMSKFQESSASTIVVFIFHAFHNLNKFFKQVYASSILLPGTNQSINQSDLFYQSRTKSSPSNHQGNSEKFP